jgi:DNA replication and repair protein RecF
MSFTDIRFLSFRNLVDASLNISAEKVFFVGENGQGKTNILEALYFLSYGASFRGSSVSEVATRGRSSFCLAGKGKDNRQGSEALLDDIRLLFDGKIKDIRINDHRIRDRKELVERNPVIAFCHEDFAFAAGEPERRRFFFDQTAGLVSPTYIDILREYKRILKQRNVALKEKRYTLLDDYDFQLSGVGAHLVEYRVWLKDELNTVFSLRYEAVSLLGSEVTISYHPSWPTDSSADEIAARLKTKRPEEVGLGSSLSGPHRDRWVFARDGRDFSATASTGQRRLLSLTLRMVQAIFYTKMTGRLPVLLLDDVLLELDRGRRRRFLELLPNSGQSFYTFLPGESWEDYRTPSTLVYEVKDGRFSN